MRCKARSIRVGIVVLDQRHLLRCLIREMVPAVIRIVTYFEWAALAIGVDMAHRRECARYRGNASRT